MPALSQLKKKKKRYSSTQLSCSRQQLPPAQPDPGHRHHTAAGWSVCGGDQIQHGRHHPARGGRRLGWAQEPCPAEGRAVTQLLLPPGTAFWAVFVSHRPVASLSVPQQVSDLPHYSTSCPCLGSCLSGSLPLLLRPLPSRSLRSPPTSLCV